MSEIEFKLALSDSRRSLKRDDLNFKLTLENLGFAVGLSKQHLHNLERRETDRQTKANTPKKYSLSYQKLKEVILFLSLSALENKHVDFINKRRNGEFPNDTFFSKYGYPEATELDLEKFRRLLFSATDLLMYSELFLPVGKISNSKNELDKYFEIRDNNGVSLYEKKINEINHNYQVWTLSDVLGESLFDESAKKTADYILKFKIHYVNFIPLTEDTEWRIAYKRISRNISDILASASKELNSYWTNDDKWENYWTVYGISESAFFTRLRIYNALSPDAKGNYNVGGTTLESIEFVNIIQDEVSAIKRKLNNIVKTDNAGMFSSKEKIPIAELNCYANKKFPFKN